MTQISAMVLKNNTKKVAEMFGGLKFILYLCDVDGSEWFPSGHEDLKQTETRRLKINQLN